MAARSPLGHALIAGAGCGVVAALTAVLPSLWWGVADTRSAEYAALLMVLIGSHMGLGAVTRHAPQASFTQRLVASGVIASLACTCLGAGLYLLYAVWRPALLAARYAALLAQAGTGDSARAALALADLAARKAQYLDPLYQAVNGAGTPLFFALLLGGYSTFRWRVAARLAAARRRR